MFTLEEDDLDMDPHRPLAYMHELTNATLVLAKVGVGGALPRYNTLAMEYQALTAAPTQVMGCEIAPQALMTPDPNAAKLVESESLLEVTKLQENKLQQGASNIRTSQQQLESPQLTHQHLLLQVQQLMDQLQHYGGST